MLINPDSSKFARTVSAPPAAESSLNTAFPLGFISFSKWDTSSEFPVDTFARIMSNWDWP